MTVDQYAPAVLKAGRDLGITPRGIVIGFATVYVESDWVMYANESDPASLNYPHDGISEDANSDGLFQQRDPWWGTVAQRMDPYQSAVLFFTALKRLDYNNPANSPGSYAQAVQGSAYPDRYDQHMDDAQALYDRIAGGTVTTPVDPNRPDYNEYEVWSDNSQDRGGKKPTVFLLHTNEGDTNADQLARWMQGDVGVSYHYAISEDYKDRGVTVCDVVDTDLASWSVGDANNISINLCFAGSKAAWTRDQWLAQGRAIDVAAYLAVEDCQKYGMSTLVVPPPYSAGTPGISDHRWVTDVFGWGTHTDVGDNFPWDVFAAAVAKYAGQQQQPTPTPQPEPTPPPAPTPQPTSDHQLLQEIWDQLRGPGGNGWPQLGGRTLVDAIAELLKGTK